eukprot:Nk52_evm6s225 gene=Nk52_evmTU6s225
MANSTKLPKLFLGIVMIALLGTLPTALGETTRVTRDDDDFGSCQSNEIPISVVNPKTQTPCFPCEYDPFTCSLLASMASASMKEKDGSSIENRVTDEEAPELVHMEALMRDYIDLLYTFRLEKANLAFHRIQSASPITATAETRSAFDPGSWSTAGTVGKVMKGTGLLKNFKYIYDLAKPEIEASFEELVRGMLFIDDTLINVKKASTAKSLKVLKVLGYVGVGLDVALSVWELIEHWVEGDTTYKRIHVDVIVKDYRVLNHKSYAEVLTRINKDRYDSIRQASAFFEDIRKDRETYNKNKKQLLLLALGEEESVFNRLSMDTLVERVVTLPSFDGLSPASLLLRKTLDSRSSQMTALDLFRTGMLFFGSETVIVGSFDYLNMACAFQSVPYARMNCPKAKSASGNCKNFVAIFLAGKEGNTVHGLEYIWNAIHSDIFREMIGISEKSSVRAELVKAFSFLMAETGYLNDKRNTTIRTVDALEGKDDYEWSGDPLKDNRDQYILLGNVFVQVTVHRMCKCTSVYNLYSSEQAETKFKECEAKVQDSGNEPCSECLDNVPDDDKPSAKGIVEITNGRKESSTSQLRHLVNVASPEDQSVSKTFYVVDNKVFETDQDSAIASPEKGTIKGLYTLDGFIIVAFETTTEMVVISPYSDPVVSWAINSPTECSFEVTLVKSKLESAAGSEASKTKTDFQTIGSIVTTSAGKVLVDESAKDRTKNTLLVYFGTDKGFVGRTEIDILKSGKSDKCLRNVYKLGVHSVVKLVPNYKFFSKRKYGFAAITSKAEVFTSLSEDGSENEIEKVKLFESFDAKKQILDRAPGKLGGAHIYFAEYEGNGDGSCPNNNIRIDNDKYSYSGICQQELNADMLDGTWIYESDLGIGSKSDGGKVLEFRLVSLAWYPARPHYYLGGSYDSYFLASSVFYFRLRFPTTSTTNTKARVKPLISYHRGPMECQGCRNNPNSESVPARDHWNCYGSLRTFQSKNGGRDKDKYPDATLLRAHCNFDWLLSTTMNLPSMACVVNGYFFAYTPSENRWVFQVMTEDLISSTPTSSERAMKPFSRFQSGLVSSFVVFQKDMFVLCTIAGCTGVSMSVKDGEDQNLLSYNPIRRWTDGIPEMSYPYGDIVAMVKPTDECRNVYTCASKDTIKVSKPSR